MHPQQTHGDLPSTAGISNVYGLVTQVKLPKLDLKRFDGNISKWPSFWDAFESSVHNNTRLAAIDKFNYLNSLLVKSASEAISGLSLTAANYDEAIAILKRRFGNKQLIINKHMETLINITSIKSGLTGNTQPLRQLYDLIESQVRSLKSLGVSPNSYGSLLSSVVMSKLPHDLRLMISREVKDGWDLDRILEVFRSELEARELADGNNVNTVDQSSNKFPRGKGRKEVPTDAALLTKESKPTCTYCRMDHASNDCKTVTNIAARKELLKRAGRCFICLKRNHISKDCTSRMKCLKCGLRHHVSICTSSTGDGVKPLQHAPIVNGSTSSSQGPLRESSGSTALYVNASTPILLQTAKAVIYRPDQPTNKFLARLILDTGSQRTYVTTKVKNDLNLPTEGKQTISVKTFGSSEENTMSVDIVRLCISAEDGDEVQLSAFAVPLICDPLQGQSIARASLSHSHLRGLKLADDCSGDDDVMVDILVGSDQYWQLVTGRVVRGEHGPTAIQTKLGWVLSGPLHGDMQNEHQQSNLVTVHVLKTAVHPANVTNESLDGNMRRFWDLESLGIKQRSVYEEFEEKISFQNSRYEVHLPWKMPHPPLPDNYELSLKRLSNLLKRLNQDPEVLREYDSVIREQLRRGIVEVVEKPDEGEVGKTHYLPHHAVIRRDKTSTKLRVVYDASAKSNGTALNDCLYTGPPLTENIFDILLRFRANRVALVGDVEKAFLMVGIAEEDRDVLRFLWVDNIERDSPEIVVLRFTRVVFGVCSSPFLLNATMKYHIEGYKEEDPEFVDQFLRSIYVDDLSSGAADSDAAYELYLKSKLRLSEGGFNLRKFVSNSKELVERIQHNEAIISAPTTSKNTEQNVVMEEEGTYAKSVLGAAEEISSGEHKVLGVKWNFDDDHFVFDLKEIACLARDIEPTKRNVVSVAAKFYDPLGFLSPVIIQFKIFFQELCKSKVDWDEPLEGELKKGWQTLVAGLQGISSFTLSRCYFQGIADNILTCSLHGFGDASRKAYAAVIYLHITTTTGSYIKFVASRSRVAPLKEETIPRLELLAALIVARLTNHVYEALEPEVNINEVTCWTDSKVALAWIKGEEREWKPFVQNRVNEIRTLVPVNSWKHCRGKNNPADIPSRGMSPLELSECALWIGGPTWLTEDEESASEEFNDEQLPRECLDEMKVGDKEKWKAETSSSLLVSADQGTVGIATILKCEDYSDLQRLLRVTALILKFVKIMKAKLQKDVHTPEELTSQDVAEAETLWIKEVQSSLSKNPKFEIWRQQFGLFTDEHGTVRCKGRLSQAQLPSSTKYPILLDKSHHITSLIVRESHKRVMHGGVKSTLTELRSRYWIVQGRQFVRKLLYQCVVCRRLEGRPYGAPPPPPLPEFRVKEDPPFTYVGIDFAGPLYVKSFYSPQRKVWICLYTCCVTRAIHLDLVPDLSATTFLRSFRRFTARRGKPSLVVSDNGKTFKPAAREITRILNDPGVKRHFAKEHMKWTFNLEKAPWWGGVFERLVRSVKRCLKKTISGARLTYEELLTVITEVEMILNCRPLSYVSGEDIEEPLTPSHLLCGRRLMSLPDNSESQDLDTDVQPQDLDRRMQHLSNVMNHFWRRWRNEYLLELRNTHRSVTQRASNRVVSTGDVVIVHDEDQPRGKWRIGRIESLITGSDGCVRGATVRVKTKKGRSSMLRRPVQRLYPLEVQCRNDEPVPTVSSGRTVPVPTVSSVTPEPQPEQRRTRPRRAAAVKADQRRKTWLN